MRNAMRGLMAGILLFVSVPARAQDAAANEAAIPRIGVAEFAAALAEGRVIVLDVRDQASYEAGHVPGAILVQFMDLQARARELKGAKKIIVAYCA
jgi:predicted sulfurtransferase